MKATAIISILIALGLAAVTWYVLSSLKDTEQERNDLRNSREELQIRIDNLQHEKAALAQQLEGQISSISKEKEEEIGRLRQTYDTLVADLKTEIDNGQITITKLADRLSVSMVDRILFPSGEADISEEGVAVLQRVGKILKSAERKVVRVEGHTDNVPISTKLMQKFPTNWELSAARAINVVRFLQDKVGIAPAKLEAVGLSEFHPVAGNTTPRGRSQNRRIDIALLPDYRETPAADR